MLDSFYFDFATFAQNAGEFLDVVGVVAILFGAALSTAFLVSHFINGRRTHDLYRSYRHNLARSILVGLEFLVAGDIIRTVAGELHLEGVLVLGLIVLIRTIVSIEFEMGIEGRWPWNRARDEATEKPGHSAKPVRPVK